ncbi:MAG: nucleotidyltransferase, partial [Acetivibrio sp.]
FSIYDAIEAGFEKIVFIIKKQDEAEFRACIGDRMEKLVEVAYVYQEMNNLPVGYHVPEGRTKPYGTGHAILSCKGIVDGPFAVINADDYYGKNAYKMLYDYLEKQTEDEKYHYTMVGYVLENTLTENGHVARGVCEMGENGFLKEIHERTHIEKRNGAAEYTEDDGKTWVTIPEGSCVSMNMWGFGPSILEELEKRFPIFLDENLEKNPLKCEYFLPMVVGELLTEGKASVEVQKSLDKWYGVTYHEDKEAVMQAIQQLKDKGLYPERLWDGES